MESQKAAKGKAAGPTVRQLISRNTPMPLRYCLLEGLWSIHERVHHRRANVAPTRQSRPDYGLGFHVQVLNFFKLFPLLPEGEVTCGPISPYSGRYCVNSLRSSYTGLYPQRKGGERTKGDSVRASRRGGVVNLSPLVNLSARVSTVYATAATSDAACTPA